MKRSRWLLAAGLSVAIALLVVPAVVLAGRGFDRADALSAEGRASSGSGRHAPPAPPVRQALRALRRRIVLNGGGADVTSEATPERKEFSCTHE
jgi:hypothetical protein